MSARPAKYIVVSPWVPSTVHGSASGTPCSTASGVQVKSIHCEAALRRATTTPTGMRASGVAAGLM